MIAKGAVNEFITAVSTISQTNECFNKKTVTTLTQQETFPLHLQH
jgi:hypothetical protein